MLGFFVFWTCSVTNFYLFIYFLFSDSLLRFFFKDFSSKFVCHKNVESVPDFAEGIPFFLFSFF